MINFETSQHNHKCLLIGKEIFVLRGGQFAPARGGQFAPADTDKNGRRKVVNLLRRRLDILTVFSNQWAKDNFIIKNIINHKKIF